MRIGAGHDIQRNAVSLGIKSDIDLIVLEVCAGRELRGIPPKPVGMQILCVEPFLIPRIMLLNAVPVYGIIQEKREVGVEVKQRSTRKPIGFKTVSGLQSLPVIHTRGPKPNSAAIARVQISETGQVAGRDKIQRDLP